jgi:hypothetical protein
MAMLQTKNPLLARDDVGKAPPTCYDLPKDDFTFGRPDNPDFEGAREVTMQWVSHVPSPRPQMQIQDFQKLNRLAIPAKAYTHRDVGKFRKTKDVPLTAREHGVVTKVLPSDVVPGFTYGKKTRPSTPIGKVVSYEFAADCEKETGEKYEYLRAEKEKAAEIRKIKLTTAAHGHASIAKKTLNTVEDNKDLFKLKKFKRILPKVEFPGGKSAELKRISDDPPVTPPTAEVKASTATEMAPNVDA